MLKMHWHWQNGWSNILQVEFVQYPGLKSSPYNALAKKYLTNGFGGILNFGIKGEKENGKQIY